MTKKIRQTMMIISLIFILGIVNYLAASMNIIEDDTDSLNTPTEPEIQLTLEWLLLQAVPSPQWVTTENNSLNFGMRWQITPLLYSFGINKKLSPWRTMMSEPLTRQSGSVEIFFTPDYLNLNSTFKNNWLFRGGFRAYFPLWHKGEYLSYSLASSYYNFNGENGISYEAGIYLFAGILGIQTTYSPTFKNSKWIFTIRIRYF